MPSAPGPSRRALILGASGVLGAGACGADASGGAESTVSRVSQAGTRSSGTSSSPRVPNTPSAQASLSGQASPSGAESARAQSSAPPAVVTSAGPDIEHADSGRDEVALTFHGQGSAAITQEVLAACAADHALITVFAVGSWVRDSPAQVRAIAAAGHQVGNHTWSHLQMPSISGSQARTEIALGKEALQAAGVDPGWAFRPSGTRLSTATIRTAAKASGYLRCISYDVDPEDFLDPGAALVRSRIKAQVRAGSIISLHLGHAGTAEALPGILTDLRQLGLKPVTLSTLLSA